jgi:8-hydroxy-5-deazaflavin:NADPH oxidoreductase
MTGQREAPHRVGVLGSGDVGRALARGFADRGHDVVIGSRDGANEELAAWAREAGDRTRTGTFADAADHGELVVLAVLGTAVEEAIAQAGPERFSGKVVIDATNPLDFSQGFPPRLAWGHDDSGGEHVQRAIPDARVVKAFNTIGNAYFIEPRFGDEQPTMFIAGDDEDAKRTVADVLRSFGWPPAVDAGGIEASRLLEPMCILWVAIGAKRGAFDHGFRLVAG